MSAEFDIFGGFIDEKVLQSFKDLEKQAERTASKMQEIAKAKDDIFGKISKNPELSNKKLENALEAQNLKLKQIQEKHNNDMIILKKKYEEKISAIEFASSERTKRAMKDKTGYVNQLEKEVKDLKAAYHALNEEEFNSAKGAGMLSALTKKREELAKIRASYGDNTMYVGQYSRATNGLRQSFMMLAGEMPNFAQSFRIGLMSLSNNWMGLSQAIGMAKEEQRNLMKQFKDGLIDKKPDSLIKMITKSMFSFNLVLMAGVTILQVYVEDIAKWVEEMIEGANTAKKFAKALNDVNKEAGDLMKGKKQKVQEFIHDYKIAFQNGDKEMLKMLEERGQKEYDLNKQQLALIVSDRKNAATDIFKDYLQKAEDAYFDEVIIKKKVDAQVNAEIAVNKAQNIFRAGSNNKSVKGKLKSRGIGTESLTFETLKRAAYDESVANGIFEALSVTGAAQDVVDALKEAIEANKVIKYLPKLRNKSYVSDDKKDTKGGGSKKTFSEIDVRREYYKSEEELLRQLAKLEDDITKENKDGVLNAYEKREKAATLYYETVMAKAKQEKDVAIINEDAKKKAELERIEAIYNKNVAKFGKDSAEASKSKGELDAAKITLEQNQNDELLRINDIYTKKLLEAEEKKRKDLRAIAEDIYSDKVYMLERTKEAELFQAKLRNEIADSEAKKSSILGLMAGSKGGNAFADIDRKAAQDRAAQDKEVRKLEKQLAAAPKGSQEAKNIERQMNEAMRKGVDITSQAENDKILLNEQMVEDAKASIAEDSIATLKSLWDSYYQYQADKIDEQLEIQTKANDERIKQYEDETDAGLHSAKELKDFKANATAYQTSQEEEAARKKKELEKEQFLLEQAFALGQVWINYAINVAKEGFNPLAQAWLLGSAIASSALIAAQTIPAFEHGGDVTETGLSLVGEKRHELVYNPRTGKAFITPNKPTFMNLERGMHVYPDINKLDLDSFNLSQQAIPTQIHDDRLLDEVKQLNRNFSKQKPQPINGLRLMQQLQFNQKIITNRRGLLN